MNTPFLTYGNIRLLNIPCMDVLARESITEDCYQIKDLKGQWAIADIGACYGEFSFFAASLGHIVHAYEPSIDSLEILTFHERLNGSLHFYSGCAVKGKASTVATHYYRPHHPAGSGSSDWKDGQLRSVPVASMSEVILKLKKYDRPILAKLDCEGDEVDIFNHIDTWIEDVQAISMETHNNDADVFGKLLEDRGFNVKLYGTCPYPLPPWEKGMIGGLVIARKP